MNTIQRIGLEFNRFARRFEEDLFREFLKKKRDDSFFASRSLTSFYSLNSGHFLPTLNFSFVL
jgi:hypothetical protein